MTVTTGSAGTLSSTCRPIALTALVLHCCLHEGLAQKEQKFELDIPRVTVEELERNVTLRTGLHAYVLHGFAHKWKAMNWTLDYLMGKIPFEWVDYYPNNMRDVSSKPYLWKFDKAVREFQIPKEFRTGKPKYMQIRLGLRGWKRLKKDFVPKPLPEVFWDDDEWIGSCMSQDGKVDQSAINNFFVTNQWKFLLIGEEGTSMFFHKDGTAASSWQVQLVGKKRWTLCPNSESQLLHTELDTYNPDYSKFPRFAQAACGQVTVSPGELLYYPAYWWHHTLQ
ncbi:hif1an, partial [Symbiodinium microadriaticum]